MSFHQAAQLPAAGSGLHGARRLLADGTLFPVNPAWTVRDFIDAIERHAAETAGIGVRVVALTNPARGKALPPHEQAVSCFNDGDRAIVVGDAQPTPYPSPPGALDLGRLRPKGEPVPVTIFTGFLGSGKTTVLNHLLMGQRDKKFAVIENEFGEVPIDNELLQNSAMDMAEQVVVMENGCMCCTVRGDLLGAFDAIRRQMETGSPLDAVLVETTGMADPVPIVRTLRQTPDIARYFRLDGTITLVDTKTIRDRLAEFEGGKDDQERHRQISFADRLLLNKLDLVSDVDVVEVFHRIRSFNSTAKVIGCVKGIVPASDLTGIGAFNMEAIAAEQSEGHGGHGEHGHGHGHNCNDECDHGHGHGHGHDEECTEDHGAGHRGGHGHAHLNSNHDKEIGSFSLVHRGMEVEPLAFARWVRVIATLPPEQGVLYRSKGVLAAAGRSQKLIFHAVADVTETQDGPEWGDNEPRVCKMVFIGKKLDRAKIEERFMKLLQPVRPRLRARVAGCVPAPRVTLLSAAQGGMLQRALLACWTKDVLRLSQCSAGLHDVVFAPEAFKAFQMAAADLPQGKPHGLHRVDGHMWLHGLLPMSSVARYAQAWRQAGVKLNTPAGPGYIYGVPLDFEDTADVEADHGESRVAVGSGNRRRDPLPRCNGPLLGAP